MSSYYYHNHLTENDRGVRIYKTIPMPSEYIRNEMRIRKSASEWKRYRGPQQITSLSQGNPTEERDERFYEPEGSRTAGEHGP